MDAEKKLTEEKDKVSQLEIEDTSNLGVTFFEAIAGKPKDLGSFYLGY